MEKRLKNIITYIIIFQNQNKMIIHSSTRIWPMLSDLYTFLTVDQLDILSI